MTRNTTARDLHIFISIVSYQFCVLISISRRRAGVTEATGLLTAADQEKDVSTE